MTLTLEANCEFCRECPFFDPEFEKMGAGDKAGWQMKCCHKDYCVNAIHMFLQKRENKAKQTDNACSSWFDFVKDSR